MHITLVVVFPLFSGLFWWQVQRVRQGNTLSWAYVFEWPFFLGYAIYLWWKLVHDPIEDNEVNYSSARTSQHTPKWLQARRQKKRLIETKRDEDEKTQMLAYNAYLASLDEENAH